MNFLKRVFEKIFGTSPQRPMTLARALFISFTLHIVGAIFAFTSLASVKAPLKPDAGGINVELSFDSTIPVQARLSRSSAAAGPLSAKAAKGENDAQETEEAVPRITPDKQSKKSKDDKKEQKKSGDEKGSVETSLEKKQREQTDEDNLLKTVETLRSRERSFDAEQLTQKSKVSKEDEQIDDDILASAVAGLVNNAPLGKAVKTRTQGFLSKVSSHYARCWNIPAGIRGIKDLRVELMIQFDAKGFTNRAQVIDTDDVADRLSLRTLSESALRAVWNPECNPLDLPLDRYQEWKTLIIEFNPHNASG